MPVGAWIKKAETPEIDLFNSGCKPDIKGLE
jgi:hypothetical protein